MGQSFVPYKAKPKIKRRGKPAPFNGKKKLGPKEKNK